MLKFRQMKKERIQTKAEELVNAVTHGIGFGLAIAALIILVVFAAKTGEWVYVAGTLVFGLALTALYFASMMYHSLPQGKWKDRFHVLDHVSIYLLIAGSYTPVTLIAMPGAWKWFIIIVIWTAAITGIVLKLFWFKRFKIFSLILYAVMGWMIIIALKPLIENVNTTSLIFMTAGGIFYTAGIGFYVWKNLKFSHSIWHLFVLGGSICHFFMVFFVLV
jgi:hemolysin III